VLLAAQAAAQEISLLGGGTYEHTQEETSYGWQLEYAHALGEHAYASFSWLNEGHVPNHHRDGHAAQVLVRTLLFERRLSLAAGLGPYRYYDTAQAERGAGYDDDHGWGLLYSAAATWYAQGRWLINLRVNRTRTPGSSESTTLLAGVGYQLEAPRSRGPISEPRTVTARTTTNEVSLFLGRSILNSFGSEGANVASVEYRRTLGVHLDGTLGWIYEGDNHIIRRQGLTTQLWLARAFPGLRLVLGVGAGPYVALTRCTSCAGDQQRAHTLAIAVTVGASYRLDPPWLARISWSRLVTDYDRDSDVILLGLGRRF